MLTKRWCCVSVGLWVRSEGRGAEGSAADRGEATSVGEGVGRPAQTTRAELSSLPVSFWPQAGRNRSSPHISLVTLSFNCKPLSNIEPFNRNCFLPRIFIYRSLPFSFAERRILAECHDYCDTKCDILSAKIWSYTTARIHIEARALCIELHIENNSVIIKSAALNKGPFRSGYRTEELLVPYLLNLLTAFCFFYNYCAIMCE